MAEGRLGFQPDAPNLVHVDEIWRQTIRNETNFADSWDEDWGFLRQGRPRSRVKHNILRPNLHLLEQEKVQALVNETTDDLVVRNARPVSAGSDCRPAQQRPQSAPRRTWSPRSVLDRTGSAPLSHSSGKPRARPASAGPSTRASAAASLAGRRSASPQAMLSSRSSGNSHCSSGSERRAALLSATASSRPLSARRIFTPTSMSGKHRPARRPASACASATSTPRSATPMLRDVVRESRRSAQPMQAWTATADVPVSARGPPSARPALPAAVDAQRLSVDLSKLQASDPAPEETTARGSTERSLASAAASSRSDMASSSAGSDGSSTSELDDIFVKYTLRYLPPQDKYYFPRTTQQEIGWLWDRSMRATRLERSIGLVNESTVRDPTLTKVTGGVR